MTLSRIRKVRFQRWSSASGSYSNAVYLKILMNNMSSRPAIFPPFRDKPYLMLQATLYLVQTFLSSVSQNHQA
jgi:hypothetical protein